MIKASASVCIEAKSKAVWERLSKLEDIVLWSKEVLQATCTGRGVDAERICKLAGNITTREHLIAWEEDKSFQYEAFGVPLMKRATNRWSIRAEGEKTLLTSEAELELKGGIFGRILEPFVSLMIRVMGRRALASFKYLVENGRPYEGKASGLPRVSSSC